MGARAVPTGILRRVVRRPFGRLNTAFYEWEAAPAVADIVGPVIAERIVTHLETAAQAPDRRPIVDIGAGGGRIAARVAAATGNEVLAVEPSPHESSRLRRRGSSLVTPVEGSAESLPADDGSCAAVYSSCTIKHWRDVDAGLRESIRVAAPGGLVLTVEIDGANSEEMRAFARRQRVFRRLDGFYARIVGRAFMELGPSATEVGERLAELGATDITQDRIPGLPFWIVSATAPSRRRV